MIDDTEFDSPRTGLTPHEAEVDPARLITSARPQPGWVALDHARDHGFTGEIVFHARPEVRVYVDNGVVYFAERAGDETLGRRLLAAGLVDAVQLERGTVRVGGVEHLGRLFDREPSIDRDAVLVLTEDTTAALVADLANNVIAPTTATAYRHHGSGVHRWFVAPTGGGVLSRPVSDVALVDNSVVEQLPGLPPVDAAPPSDELRIEWDEPLDGDLGSSESEAGSATAEDDLFGVLLDDADLSDLLGPGFGTPIEAEPVEPGPLAPPPTDGSGAAPGSDVVSDRAGVQAPLAEPDVVAQRGVAPFAPPVVDAAGSEPEDRSPAFGELAPAPAEPGDPATGEPAIDETPLAAPLTITDVPMTEPRPADGLPTVEVGAGLAAMPAPAVEPDQPVSPVESADPGSAPLEFAPLRVDLDALSSDHVDPDAFDASPSSGAIELADDDEFHIVWPDGTEEVPTTGVGEVLGRRSTDDAFARLDDDGEPTEGRSMIVGEVLLPQHAPSGSPIDRGDSLVAPAPGSDALVDMAAGSDAPPDTLPVEAADDSWVDSVDEPVVFDVVSEPAEVAAMSEVVPVVSVVSESVDEPVVFDVVSESAEVAAMSEVVPVVPESVDESVAEPAGFDVVSELSESVDELVVSDVVPVVSVVSESVDGSGVSGVSEVSDDVDDVDEDRDGTVAAGELLSQPADAPSPPAPGRIDFEVPALVLSDVPTADGQVPDEVSNAVLRAIRAIEAASMSAAAPSVARIAGTESPPAPPPQPATMGFAPPTLETSAEAMYAAAAREASVVTAVAPVVSSEEPAERRVASVVFVDDEDVPETEDRAGALRRLIDSLRRR